MAERLSQDQGFVMLLLTTDEVETLSSALSDAVDYLTDDINGVFGECVGCDEEGLCADHKDDLERASRYEGLRIRLQGRTETNG